MGVPLNSHLLINRSRWIFLAALTGTLAGLSAFVFLFLLDWATTMRLQNPLLIWGLPVAGLGIGWLYHRVGRDVAGGHALILDEIHEPQKWIPLSIVPLILFSTVVTHLFGGSAGREGTVVQMGAALSEKVSRLFRVPLLERKILLMAGMGAGFGAAIGTPWAGAIFGLEVIAVGSLSSFAWLECLVAAWVAYGVTIFLNAPHSRLPLLEIPALELSTLLWVAVAGMIFGLAARTFVTVTHAVEWAFNKSIGFAPLKPFFGGIALVALYALEGSDRFAGLGFPLIQQALQSPAGFDLPILKGVFTALTVGTGFKGGEFVPLVFIGTTLGSALSAILPVSFSLLAALGFAAVFGGAANTPLACTIMVMEIFGYRIGPFALVACCMSYCLSGPYGLYQSQRIKKNIKLSWRGRLI